MKLVDNWKSFYTWWTVWCGAIISILSAVEIFFTQIKAFIPAGYYAVIMLVLGIAIPILRVIKQK